MEYLLHGCPGIEYYQTIKKDIPIYEYLADEASPITPVAVDEAIPLDTSIRSGASNITLEKYNTDADTKDEGDEEADEWKQEDEDEESEEGGQEEEEKQRDNEEDEMEEEEFKSEDDEVVQEKHVVEMEKGFGTIEKTGINSQPVFTPSEDTQDSIATSYEMHQARRPYQVPITKQFVFKKISGPTISTSSSSQKSSSSSSSSSSARVTRGASTKRSNTDDIVDESDDNVCYFTTQKRSKKGKK